METKKIIPLDGEPVVSQDKMIDLWDEIIDRKQNKDN